MKVLHFERAEFKRKNNKDIAYEIFEVDCSRRDGGMLVADALLILYIGAFCGHGGVCCFCISVL